MFVIKLELPGYEMIVPSRNMNDFIAGNTLARHRDEHLHRHQSEDQRTGKLSGMGQDPRAHKVCGTIVSRLLAKVTFHL